jgi:hypothetical protein
MAASAFQRSRPPLELLLVLGGGGGALPPFRFPADEPFFPYAEPRRRADPASVGEFFCNEDEEDPARTVSSYFFSVARLVRPAQ